MTKGIHAPLHPTRLPQQILYEVVTLPPRPEPFGAVVGYGITMTDPPTRKPWSSLHLCQVEWSWWLPQRSIHTYYLHRTRKDWLLWLASFNDSAQPWGGEWVIIGRVALGGVPERTAACHLLLDFWTCHCAASQVDQFHCINDAGYLRVAEILAIANKVWQD